MLSIKVDPEKCDGCGRCTAACSLGRMLRAVAPECESGEKKYTVTELAQPLLWLTGNKEYRIDLCRHCEKPVCVDVCVAGAIKPEENSITVQIQFEKCVGCWSCVMECPFGAIRLFDGSAVKCDGCPGYVAPLCAHFCPTGALQADCRSTGNAIRRRRERASVPGRINNEAYSGKRA